MPGPRSTRERWLSLGAVIGLAAGLAFVVFRSSAEPPGTVDRVPRGTDPVAGAADAALRALLDAERVASLVESAGAGSLSEGRRAALAEWAADVRASAPLPPELTYRLDPERFDAARGTWRVRLEIPGLAQALGDPAWGVEVVLAPGAAGADGAPTFTVGDARIARR